MFWNTEDHCFSDLAYLSKTPTIVVASLESNCFDEEDSNYSIIAIFSYCMRSGVSHITIDQDHECPIMKIFLGNP